LSSKPRTPPPWNIHPSPTRYLTSVAYDLRLFTWFIVDGTKMSVGLTPFSARLRHPTASTTPLRVGCCAHHITNSSLMVFCRHLYTNDVHATVTPAASYPVSRLLGVTLVVSRQPTFFRVCMRTMYVCHLFFIANKLTLNIQWVKKGYPDRITDPAPLIELGGPSKIDSIQNMILLRSDLHDAWDNYMFGVNPDVCIFHLFPVSVLAIRFNSAGM